MHVLVSTLSPAIQSALASVKYGRKDVEIKASATVSAMNAGSDGQKAFIVMVDLTTGKSQTMWGSWGGSNMFNPRNAVDLDNTTRAMPENGVVIAGHIGSCPTYATISVHPNMLPKFLPAPSAELPLDLKAGLVCLKGLKSSYRREEYHSWAVNGWESIGNNRIGKAERARKYDIVMDELVKLGYAKKNAAGSVSITTEGKNQIVSPY